MNIKLIQSIKENRIYLKETNNIYNNLSTNKLISVYTGKKYQTIKGFGGAFTESAAYVLNKMSKEAQNELLNAYFSADGLNYNLGRVHINSCDFSIKNYTYVNENDNSLESFDISHEKELVIPMILNANKIANKRIKLLASPWSPPAYMKTNNEMNHGGKLLDEYKPLWAKYYVKYIQAMNENGIIIDALTVQNEPEAVQTWDSCIYEPAEERDFVKNHLGPELHKNGLENIHLYVWDHNRGDVLVNRAKVILDDQDANKYVYGLAFHWYCSEDFNSLTRFHKLYPNKELLFSEGCVEYGVYGDESKLRWENGEHYAHHMINDFNNYSNGFIDWNLYLDINGGPNHVNNFCEAPIMVDYENNKIIYNTSYYYIGHFSKYVQIGAIRISSKVKFENNNIESVAFLNPDNSIVTIILNRGLEETISIKINKELVSIKLPTNSISTLIINK